MAQPFALLFYPSDCEKTLISLIQPDNTTIVNWHFKSDVHYGSFE